MKQTLSEKAHNKSNGRMIKSAAVKILTAVFWIAVWEIIALIVNEELLVASPVRVASRLFVLANDISFWETAALSLLRITAGYLAGVIAGSVLACGSAFSRFFDSLTSPLNTVIKATPVASFIILALVFIKASMVPSFIAFLIVTPIVWNNLKSGLLSADRDLIEMTNVYKMSKAKKIKVFWLPSMAPHFISALITSLGLAWKAGIAAEVLCTPKNSIGKQIYESKLYLETTDLFAWTVVVILMSLVIESIVKSQLERVYGAKWKH